MGWLCMYLLEYESKLLGKSDSAEYNLIYDGFDVDGLKWLSRDQRMNTRRHEMGKFLPNSNQQNSKFTNQQPKWPKP